MAGTKKKPTPKEAALKHIADLIAGEQGRKRDELRHFWIVEACYPESRWILLTVPPCRTRIEAEGLALERDDGTWYKVRVSKMVRVRSR